MREAEAAVLPRDLHPEGAELREAADDLLGVLAGLVDRHRIDPLLEEAPHPVVEVAEGRSVRLLDGVGVDEVQPEAAEEQVFQEARALPFPLAGGLGDVA